MNKVQSTTNYGKFRKVRGNRVINRRYLSKLAESIQENNLLPQNPIIVNERMQVLDGQHRLKIAKLLSFPIHYTVVKTGSLKEVQMLNTNVRQWTANDFLESYVSLGNKDYIQLKEFSESNDISIANSLALLTGGNYSGYGQRQRLEDFRSGDFKANHKEYANKFAKKLVDVSKYLEEGVVNHREFIKALEKTYTSGYTHDYLMEKLKKSKARIKRSVNFKEYIRDLEDVISFRTRSIKRILKGEGDKL